MIIVIVGKFLLHKLVDRAIEKATSKWGKSHNPSRPSEEEGAYEGGGRMATRDPRYTRSTTYRRDPADDPNDLFRPLRDHNDPRQRQYHGGGDQPPPPNYPRTGYQQQPANQPVAQQTNAGVNLGAGLIMGLICAGIPLVALIAAAYFYPVPNPGRFAYLAPRAYLAVLWAGIALALVLGFVAANVAAIGAYLGQLRIPNQEELARRDAAIAFLQAQNERLVEELDRQHEEIVVVHQTVDEQAAFRGPTLTRDDVRHEVEQAVRDLSVTPERANELVRQTETRLQRALDAKADNTNVGEIGVQVAALRRSIDELRRELGSHMHPVPPTTPAS